LWDLHHNVAESSQENRFARVTLSPLGTLFVTNLSDGTIEIREVESSRLAWTQPSDISVRRSHIVTISPDDKFLALYDHGMSAPIDIDAYIFDLQSGRLYARLERTGKRGIKHVSFRSNSRQVAFATWDDEVELWDLDSRIRVWEANTPRWPNFVAFSPKNEVIAWSGGYYFGLLDAISGEPILEQRCGDGIDLVWAADGTQLLTSHGILNVCIYHWDVTSSRSTRQARLLCQYNTSDHIESYSFSDSHKSIVTDLGPIPIHPQHRPLCSTDDLIAPLGENLLRLQKDGWIWQVGLAGKRRVCWLPPAYRPAKPQFKWNFASLRDTVVLITDSGRLVVLKIRDWFEDVD
jgi:WD40 repeat protein